MITSMRAIGAGVWGAQTGSEYNNGGNLTPSFGEYSPNTLPPPPKNSQQSSGPIDPGAGPSLLSRAMVNVSHAVATGAADHPVSTAIVAKPRWQPGGPTSPGDQTPNPNAMPGQAATPAPTAPGNMPAPSGAGGAMQPSAPIAVNDFAPTPFPAGSSSSPSASQAAAVAASQPTGVASPGPLGIPTIAWGLGAAALGVGAFFLLRGRRGRR